MSNLPATQKVSTRSFAALPNLYAGGIGWWILCAVLAGLAGLGGYAFLQQEHYGDIITGMRSMGQGGVPWGLYILMDVYWVGVSFAAVTLAAIIRLFHITALKPLSRLAELVAIVTVMLGGCSVMADQGRPLEALLNLPAYGRPGSPFFGTFSMIMGGYLCASLVFFYLSSRADAGHCMKLQSRWRWVYQLWAMGFKGQHSEYIRHHRVSFWLSLIILPLILIAYSTLGFVFGIQSGRPGWFSALQAPSFVVTAAVSGLGVLIVLAAGIRYFLKLENIIQEKAFRWLGNGLLVLTLISLYFIIVEEMTSNYAALSADTLVAHETVFKTYGHLFWIMLSSLALGFLILFAMFLRRKTWMPGLVAAGLLVNIGTILKRFLVIIPSQTHGMLLPYPSGAYNPTWIEFAFVIGVAAAGLLALLVFMKLFPIIPLPVALDLEATPDTGERGSRRLLRLAIFSLTLLTGLALMAVGLLSSLRYGTQPAADPVIPFSPVIFISGMAVALFSAVLYEIVPGKPPAVTQPAEAAGLAKLEPPAVRSTDSLSAMPQAM